MAADLGAIHRERGFGFLGEIGQFRDAGLHLVGHLVLGDAGGDLGIAEVVALDFVEVREVVQHVAANLAAEAGGVRQIEHGIAGAAEGDALIFRGEKTAAPVEIIKNLAAAGLFIAGGHDDVGGKFLGLAAEAVAEPCAHRGAPRLFGAGEKVSNTGGVVHGFRVQRLHVAEIVGDRGDLRKKIGDPRAGFAVLGEVRDLAEDRAGGLVARHGRESFAAGELVGDLLTVPLAEFGFVVEEIDVGRRAVLEKVDDAFGLGREVRELGETGHGAARGDGGRRGEAVAAEE